MVEDLKKEIQKLEIRVERFFAAEQKFVNELKTCLKKFRKLNQTLENANTPFDPKTITMLRSLRVTAIEALTEALNQGSVAEHEKSHFLESYGTLILSVERALNDLS